MAELPTGTVTFLFTDIAGSTRLLESLGDRYGEVLDAHRQVIRGAVDAHAGQVVDSQGDAFFAVFSSAPAAVRAAAAAQLALAHLRTPDGGSVRIRIGLHSGEATIQDGGYVGMDIHRGARIASAGHGGQILLSESTRSLVHNDLSGGLSIKDLGPHRLKDLPSQTLYQLVVPELNDMFPDLASLELQSTNLPRSLTPFIGRRAEVEKIVNLLRTPDVRLVTVTGPGGIGKTRLALQVASDALADFPDGVFMVNLAVIAESDLVMATIGQAMGVRETGDMPIDVAVAHHLRTRRLLLFLDNFEQVLAGATSIAQLLGAAPDLKVLVTSQTPLRLATEHEYSVPALDLPDVRHLPAIAELSECESVAMFSERATSVRPGFRISNDNAAAVAEICVRLDGLPLAIELAAVQVRVLTPPALLRRLGQRLDLLTGGPVDAPARQQTLRATIDWSYRRLDKAHQLLLARLSVFEGGCDLAAAEAVCNYDARLGIDVLHGISGLLENSLLREQDDAEGDARYWMLESIRDYARERLSQSALLSIRRRHAEYFVDLGERVERVFDGDDLVGDDAPEDKMQDELPNLRAAMEVALDLRDDDLVLGLAAIGGAAWTMNSLGSDGAAWLARALDGVPNGDSVLRARVLLWLGGFEWQLGRSAPAKSLYDQALGLFREAGDDRWVIRSSLLEAELADRMGDLDAARGFVRTAELLADNLGHRVLQANVLVTRSMLEDSAGNKAQALLLHEDAIAIWERAGVPRWTWIHQLINVGWYLLQSGEISRAKTALTDYLSDRARKSPGGVAHAHGNLGLVAMHEGDPEEAATHFCQSVRIGYEADALDVVVEGLYGMAAVGALRNNAHSAVVLRTAADALRARLSAPLSTQELFLIDRFIDPLESGIPVANRSEWRAEGGALADREAVVRALRLQTDGQSQS